MFLISKWLSAFSRRIGKKHSTETVLLYFTNAVKTAMDKILFWFSFRKLTWSIRFDTSAKGLGKVLVSRVLAQILAG